MFGWSNKGVKGHVSIVDPDAPPFERDTLQCVHCGMHWIYEAGSGRKRGFCRRCCGVTCGAIQCHPCVPFEAKVEIIEGTRSRTALSYLSELLRITQGKIQW